MTTAAYAAFVKVLVWLTSFRPTGEPCFFSLPQNIPHEGGFRDGRIVEIYQNKMVSERSEFHFVISTISPSAPEPGRFWLLLWFRFFFDTEEEMNKSFCSFRKEQALLGEGREGKVLLPEKEFP